MRMRFSEMMVAYSLTILFLIITEILSATLLPVMGWKEYRLTFNVLILLFLAIRMQGQALPWLILGLEFFHAAFSVEGWALGTIGGLSLMLIVGYLKEMIQLTSPLATIIVSQVFQIVWNVICATIICLKLSDFERFGLLFWQLFPSTIFLSLISPIVFKFLDFIWRKASDHSPTGVEI